MPIEEFQETWTRIELACDGLGEAGACVAADEDGPAYVMDVAPTAEGARITTVNYATSAGWVWELKSKRWLCPDCLRARDEHQ